jgi:hypothetical protein
MSGYVHFDALASRLILSCLTDDMLARDVIGAEIGDCPHCWRVIAEHLAELITENLLSEFETDEAIAQTQANIAHDLDWLVRWGELIMPPGADE